MNILPLSLLSLTLVLGACKDEQGPTRVVKTSAVKSGVKTEDIVKGGGGKPEVPPREPVVGEEPREPAEPSEPDPVMGEPTEPVEVPKPSVPDPVEMPNDCHKGDAFTCEAEKACVEQTNSYRKSAGKGPLAHDAKIAFVSRDWSRQQAASNKISHDGFPAQRKQVYNSEFKQSANFWAENVAMSGGKGSDPVALAKVFTDMWWKSSGHKANMLGNHKNLGCGIAKGSKGYYATQLFN